MFDFSFGEMLVVGLVALVVLGPERLPKAARFVGLWVRRARAQWYSVKTELERELATDELRRSLADGQQVMRETEAEIRSADAQFRTAVASSVAEVQAPINEVIDIAQEPLLLAPPEASSEPAALDAEDPTRQDAHGY